MSSKQLAFRCIGNEGFREIGGAFDSTSFVAGSSVISNQVIGYTAFDNREKKFTSASPAESIKREPG